MLLLFIPILRIFKFIVVKVNSTASVLFPVRRPTSSLED
jgi:hypothetical protein